MKSPSLLETRVREYTALLRERLRLEELEGASCADELAEVNQRISDMQQASEFLPDTAQHDKFVWDDDESELSVSVCRGEAMLKATAGATGLIFATF